MWQAGPGAIEEEPHAQCLSTLDGHKVHMATDMVDVVEPVQLRFIVIGVPLQPRDAFLNHLPEARADLEAFLGGTLNGHEPHLAAGIPAAGNFLGGLKFLLLLPILSKCHFVRQITRLRNFGNEVSENATVPSIDFVVHSFLSALMEARTMSQQQ